MTIENRVERLSAKATGRKRATRYAAKVLHWVMGGDQLPIETALHEGEGVHQRLAQRATRLQLIEPYIKLFMGLSTVARTTGWHDVAGGCSAAERHCYEMVDGVGWARAVDASTTVHCEQLLVAFGWYGVDLALPAVDVLLALVSVRGVGGVPQAITFAKVTVAEPLAAIGHPCLASVAPRKSLRRAQQALASRRPTTSWRLSADSTRRVRAVRAREVAPEQFPSLPRAAAIAPFVTNQNPLSVLSAGDAQFSGCGLECSVSTTSHAGSVA